MCTRYYMELSPELKPYVDRALRSPLRDKMAAKLGRPLKTEGEIRPTDIAPVIAPDHSHNLTVFPMIWGFTNPHEGGQPLVNCRAETAKDKPFWKESWNRRRCIIPCSYYFEWEHYITSNGRKKAGQKYMIQPEGCTVTYLAGLYDIEERNGLRIPVFTVLTREPAGSIRFIHDRMPVILGREHVKTWMDPGSDPSEIAGYALTDMFYETAD